MKETPLVSVLMTSYNREKYIAAAIESVIASTYKHWELIIVDDQSKDTTVAIAQAYAHKDDRIKVYINEVNLGDYPNRNQAASYAKGKYLKYVDADDMIYPHGLEVLVSMMEKFPEAGYGLCSLAQDKHHIFPMQLSPYEAYFRHYFKFPLFHKAPLSSIIVRSVFEKHNGFSTKRMVGDFEMWHRLSTKENVVLMPHGIVWYREHNEQEMTEYRNNPLQPFQYKLLSIEFMHSADCPLSEENKTKVIKNIRKEQAVFVLSALKKRKFNLAQMMMKQSGLTTISSLRYYLT